VQARAEAKPTRKGHVILILRRKKKERTILGQRQKLRYLNLKGKIEKVEI